MQILAQNPAFHSSPTSGLCSLVKAMTQANATNEEEKSNLRPDEQRKRMQRGVRGLIDGWYSEDIGEARVAFDKGRGWVGQMEMLNHAYGEPPKVLVPIRDLRGILTSAEKLWRSNPEKWQQGDMATVDARCVNWLSGQSFIGSAAERIKDMLHRGHAPDVLFIRMEDLTTNPEPIMKSVYEYLREPYYSHDFSNVKQATHEHDPVHGIYGDHDIKEGPVRPIPEEWDKYLGAGLAERIKNDNAWFYQAFYQ